MKRTMLICVALSLWFVLTVGCSEDEGVKEEKQHVYGAMAVYNMANSMLDVSIVTDGRSNDFGVLAADATATMGGGRFELGKELKVVWIENFGKENATKLEATFDTSQLVDIADKIREVEFVYIGDRKWKLRAYKALHRYDQDLIREITSD